jgi:SAM-dependent methyltransferase
MDKDEILGIYDRVYASSYDENYLLGENFLECTEYEEVILSELLAPARNWLDVGCGTGYFLSRFPHLERCGLDISPAMLEVARARNPGVPFVAGDFRIDVPDWFSRWDVVTCMWYAYCYVSSFKEAEAVIRNLAAWTALGGSCFLPVCDPDVLCKTKISCRPPADSDDGRLEIAAVIWNWIDEPSGRVHSNLVAPLPDHLVRLFKKYFSDVKLIEYPHFESDCLASRKAIVARSRRKIGNA